MNNKKNKNIDDAFRDFIKYCRIKNLADATIQFYEDSWEKFREFYDGDMEGITSELVDEYVLNLRHQKQLSDISVNTYLRGLRVIIYRFIKLHYVEDFRITIHKAEKKVKETYTDKEIEILLRKPNLQKCDFSEYRTWVIINFLLSTGCRANTICNIKMKDLKLESGIVIFTTTKNKKQQVVPLNHKMCLILQEYLAYRQPSSDDDYLFTSIYSEQMNNNSLRQSIERYNNRRGVMKQGVHSFRHTFAKLWIQNGGNIFSLQKMLGHASLEMVKEYVDIFGEDLRRDYDKYNPLNNFTNKKYISMKKGGKK